MFKLGGIKKGVNTAFRKGQNTALKIAKGLGNVSDVVHKGAVIVEKVGQATGSRQLEDAGNVVATTTNKLGNVLDKGANRLERITDKSRMIQNKVNNRINQAQDKIDDTIQRGKNIRDIVKTDGRSIVNDGKKIFNAQ